MRKRDDRASSAAVCERVNPLLAGAVDRDTELTDEQLAHVESCLRCQAELVQFRKLLRALHDLRTTVVQPAPGLLADVLDSLGERGERRAVRSMASGRRAAYTGGIAVATLAGVTGALLLAGRAKGRSARRAA